MFKKLNPLFYMSAFRDTQPLLPSCQYHSLTFACPLANISQWWFCCRYDCFCVNISNTGMSPMIMVLRLGSVCCHGACPWPVLSCNWNKSEKNLLPVNISFCCNQKKLFHHRLFIVFLKFWKKHGTKYFSCIFEIFYHETAYTGE